MPLQTQNLVMLGLSVVNDNPPNPLQPRLVDGIHLRWAFTRAIGFPWYGYYLFRRSNYSADPTEMKLDGTNLQPGSTMLNSATGRLSSDSALVLSTFIPTRVIGFDLDRRSYRRFIRSELANWVKVTPGQRSDVKKSHTGLSEAFQASATPITAAYSSTYLYERTIL